MPGTPEGAGLERLLAERGSQLMRVAIALTGNREAGEDLMQAALERVLRAPAGRRRRNHQAHDQVAARRSGPGNDLG